MTTKNAHLNVMNMKIFFITALLFFFSSTIILYAESVLSSCINDNDVESICIGIYKMPDGSEYDGEFLAGKFHGNGSLKYPDGISIKGQFRNGKPNGKVKIEIPNGAKFEGEVIDGRMLFGELQFMNGEKYLGNFKDGKYSAAGKLLNYKGDEYTGDFLEGKFNGNGKLRLKNGDQYEGNFKDGKYEGRGNLTYANKENYNGEFKANIFDGRGTFKYLSGEFYIGEFKEGKRHGIGTLFSKSGDEKFAGLWEEDKFKEYACVGYAIRNTTSVDQDGTSLACYKAKNIKNEEIQLCPEKKLIDETIDVSQALKLSLNITVVCEKGGNCWNANDFLFSNSCQRVREERNQNLVQEEAKVNDRICMRWQAISTKESRCTVTLVEPAGFDRNGQPKWNVHKESWSGNSKGGAGSSSVVTVGPDTNSVTCGGGKITFSFYNC